MAVTRIKNNQITDSTITYQKIAPGTLVGSLFNPNLTLNSNISITGNLSVAGNTTTINSIDTLVSDSLITLNNGYIGVPAYDVGILFNRALGTLDNYGGVNAALVWSETDGAFIVVLTTETGTTAGTINRAFKANLIAGNLTVANALVAQSATITTLNTTNLTLSTLRATGNILADAGTVSTTYTTGAIVVPNDGGVGIGGNLNVRGKSDFTGNITAGNILVSGNINVTVGAVASSYGVFYGNAAGVGALYAGTTGYTALDHTILQLTGDLDNYAQVNFQNINTGSSASTDYVATADNGSDVDGYINLGINSSTFNDVDYPEFYPNDGYLIQNGVGTAGNLLIISEIGGTAIKFRVGGYGAAYEQAVITNQGFKVNATTQSTSLSTGAIVVAGGLGVNGNIHAAAINNTPIGNTKPSTGAFTNLTGTDVGATTLVTTNFSTGNAVITGGYIKSVANVFAVDGTFVNLNGTEGNVTTLVATNFSSGNTRITGGYADNFPIGANVAAPGTFTTANATTINAATTNSTSLNVTTGNITNLTGLTVNVADTTTTRINSSTGNITTLTTTTVDAGTVNAAAGNITDGNVTTLVATNFSTGNARITGGYADNFPIGANVAAPGTFTTATAVTGNINTLNTTTGNITNATIGTLTLVNPLQLTDINAVNGNILTLVAGNLSSSNTRISSGYADNFPVGANVAAPGNFTTANATTVSAYTVNATALNTTNGNIVNANIKVVDSYTTNATTVNATNGNITTLDAGVTTTATLNTTNANITGGAATTLVVTNFSSGNAVITGGYINSLANLTATTTQTTNLSTGNAVISGGYISALTNAYITTGRINNFSSANVIITGGYLDNTPIGANTKSTGAFTTLTSTGATTFTNATQSDNPTTGAVVVTGGVGVGANLNVGGNVTVTGNLTVQGTTTTVNSQTLDVADINITVAKGAATPAAADGAGLTVDGANATITYANSDDSWNFNKKVNLTGINAASANITNGNVTTLYAQNFSTGNAVITGGYINGLSNLTATTTQTTNFSTANAVITGGYAEGLANVRATEGQFTNFSTGNVLINGTGNITIAGISAPGTPGTFVTADYLQSYFGLIGNLDVLVSANIYNASLSNANLISSNSRITGGWIDGTPIGPNVASTGNFTTANATTISAYTVNATTENVTDANITTLVATNFSSGNTRVSGGYADNFPVGANTAASGNFTTANAVTVTAYTVNATTENVTDANITTLVATNFSSANAQVTGGYADNFPVGANVAAPGNFTTANATTITAYTGNLTTLNATTANLTSLTTNSFSAGNITVWGANVTLGNITTLLSGTATIATINTSSANIVNGNATTLVVTNFSSGNARITGGYADNFPIGANVASTGSFTNVTASGELKGATLNATSNVYLSPQSGSATVTINPLVIGTIDNMSLGINNPANVSATNIKGTTSLNVPATGPIWLSAGTGTSGIQNIPIGSVTPSTAVFTTAAAQTLNSTQQNTFTSNITTLVATNFSSGNIAISGGYISGLANVYATLGHITNFSTANAFVTGGYADNFPIGANTAAPGTFTALAAATETVGGLQAQAIGNVTPGTGVFTTLSATTSLSTAGNLVLSSGATTVYTAAAGTANTTGALVITGTGGAAVNGNVYIGQGAVINGNQTTYDTVVRGVNERSLLTVYADSVYDQVSIGGNLTAANVTQGAKLHINSTDALIIPVGSSAQRPGSSGFTDADGMIRFNTTTNQLEYYGAGQWNNTGATFTVIAQRTFNSASGDPNGNVDGTNDTFTLPQASTSNSTLVSINGVMQIPGEAYSVTGTTLLFTEPPALGDTIDARVITTTTQVTSIASDNGYNYFQANNTSLSFYTGNVSVGTIENWRIDTNGDFYPITKSNVGAPSNRVDYLFASNIDISGGTLTGVSLGSGSLDSTVIGANIAALGSFTYLYASTTLQSNGSVVLNSGNITVDSAAGQYIAPSTTGYISGFDKTAYRGGEFLVTLSKLDQSEFQIAKVVYVHNDTTPSIETYAVTYTGAANLATFSANISGSTAYLNASSAGANLIVKVQQTLMKV